MKSFYLLFLFFSFYSFSQDSLSFSKVKAFYFKGSSQVIGNNTLSKNKIKPYGSINKVNDAFKMTYIDIDDDNSTYSSSASELYIPEDSNIAYAGLYWTGTYPGNKGVKSISGNRQVYRTIKERDKPLNKIKLKLPKKGYQDITGEILYDGINAHKISLKLRSPYVCYKDVTQLLKAQENPNGNYTIANVPALEGLVSGGSSAGWMLYVIYENKNYPLQYITSYHGFELIERKPVVIPFKNFKTIEDGKVETYLTIGALEGDNSIFKDQVYVFNTVENKYVALENKLRPANNFFNSSITYGEELFTKRTPNNTNTLGFDIVKFKIFNPNNNLISNQATLLKLKFETKDDQYFPFFVAFETKISKSFYENEILQINSSVIKQEEDHKVDLKKIEAISNESSVKIKEKIIEIPSDTLAKILRKKSIQLPDAPSGYHIITNVFSSKLNAEKWVDTLKIKKYNPEMFFRPENSFYYVSVKYSNTIEDLYLDLVRIRKDKALKKSWILKINLEE